jgi:hypothetical protein
MTGVVPKDVRDEAVTPDARVAPVKDQAEAAAGVAHESPVD